MSKFAIIVAVLGLASVPSLAADEACRSKEFKTELVKNACEKGGVELLNCWPYIQEWMIREKGKEG